MTFPQAPFLSHWSTMDLQWQGRLAQNSVALDLLLQGLICLSQTAEPVRSQGSPASDRSNKLEGQASAPGSVPDSEKKGAFAVDASSLLTAIMNLLPGVMRGVSEATIVGGQKGRWSTLARSTSPHPAGHASESKLPSSVDWLAQILDSDQPLRDNSTWGIPLMPGDPNGRLLILRCQNEAAARGIGKDVPPVAAALAMLFHLVQQWDYFRDDALRLRELLEMTALWNLSQDTDSLLRQMAETSTRWIPSQRATIFLWDKVGKQLIGKPALGIEGGELRIDDHSGLVGQVVQSGQAGRVDTDVAAEQAQIDRRTDQQLNFQTRSLLCVPLWDEDGQCVGAFELINKNQGNFTEQDQRSLQQLAHHAAIAIANTSRVEHLVSTQKTTATQAAAAVQLRGSCPPIQTLRETIARVAPTELSVLLLGENGTGKEVAAQLLHYLSRRRDEVLVAVNCAAIPENLLESELFGHEKGAFTDANQMRQGKFELASQGTIFLDEIGDMSLSGQSKLLRVLEEKTIVRVGGSQSIATAARVIAATNQDLAELVRQRKFREDLFFRLNVVTLEIPPLRQRGDDILELAQFFLETFSTQARRKTPVLSAAAQKRLLQHKWPGNVRELRNTMERLAFLSVEDKIDAADFSFITSPTKTEDAIDLDLPLNDATREFQIRYINQHIQSAHGNMTAAAERMGLHRTNLYRKMKQLGLKTDD